MNGPDRRDRDAASRLRSFFRLAPLVALALLAPVPCRAVEWDAGGGADRDWSTAANWQADTEPTASDVAFVDGGHTAVVTQAGEVCSTLHIGDGTVGTGTVVQTGGALAAGADVEMGETPGEAGRYAISGGSLTAANKIMVGDRGRGRLEVSGQARVTAGGDLSIGDGSATLTEDSGSWVQQDGGTVRVFTVTIGVNAGASGTYRLTAGMLSVTDTFAVASAASSSGTVSIAGGSASAERMRLGGNAAARAALEITGGALNLVNDGGITRHLSVGYANGSTGTVTQLGGSVTVAAGGDVQIGGEADTAAGTYVISNGTLTVGRDLVVGPDLDADTGRGTLHVKGTNAAISVGDDLLMQSDGAELRVTLMKKGVSAVRAADDLTVDGTLTVGKAASFTQDEDCYIVATSLNHSAVIGRFDATNFLDGITGVRVLYDNGAVALSFARPDNPASTQAEADGPEAADLGWAKNTAGDRVMALRRAGAPPSAGPTNGAVYPVGAGLGGGTVVYTNGALAFKDTELAADTEHYFVFYSVDALWRYSRGVTNTMATQAFHPGERVDCFAYRLGEALHGKDGGQGWTNAWIESAPGGYAACAGVFSNFCGHMPNHGHAARASPAAGQTLAARRGIEPVTNGAILASFLVSRQYGGTNRFAGLSFMDGTNELCFAGKAGACEDWLSLEVTGRVACSTRELTPGQDYAVIGKYDFGSRRLSALAYPVNSGSLPSREPEWEVSTNVAAGHIARIDGLRLVAGGGAGATPGETFFDEIRAGRTWNGLVNGLIAFMGFELTGDNWSYSAAAGQGTIAAAAGISASGDRALKLTGSTNASNPSVTFTNLNLCGYTNVVLSVAYAASGGPDSGDDLEFWVSTNGGAYVKLGYVDGFQNSTFDFGETPHSDGQSITANPYSWSVPPAARSLALKIVFRESSSDNRNDHWYVDDAKVTGLAAPEMDVLGPAGAEVRDGDSTPSAGEGTDFGSQVAAEGAADRTFTVTNAGLLGLSLGGSPPVTLSGNTADFSVQSQPSAQVAPGAATAFTIRFSPVAVGVRTALVSVANNDSDENPYDFAILGAGTLAAEPTAHASGLTFSAVTNVGMTVSWTDGNGAQRLVVARQSAAVSGAPADGTDYAASAAFGAGAPIAPGGFAVYDGTASSVAVTNLLPGTRYFFAVYEYAGMAAGINYLTSGNVATGSQVTATYAPVLTEGSGVQVAMSENGSPTPFSLTLHATDADPADTITWSVRHAPEHGTASVSGTGASRSVAYSPNAYYTGADSFEVQVTDGYGNSDVITVSVAVGAVNAPGRAVFVFE